MYIGPLKEECIRLSNNKNMFIIAEMSAPLLNKPKGPQLS